MVMNWKILLGFITKVRELGIALPPGGHLKWQ